jgi:sugar/nucleoside kinase (ribokinase family)
MCCRGRTDHGNLFTRELFANEDDDAGVFVSHLGRALVTWTAMNMEADGDRTMTVHDAAKAFNTTPEIIAEAVEEAMWIYIDGDTLQLDGE